MDRPTDSSMEFATLDPPGTIAVVGGGALGVEAALYGRFLGYRVTLIEASTIGNSAEPQRDQPLPVLPDRCLSPLAMSALATQTHESGPRSLPTTVGQWIDEGLVALTETDLLRGRVMTQTRVVSVERIPIVSDDDEEADESTDAAADFPDDFRLHLESASGENTTLDAEALILATGRDDSLHQSVHGDVEYLFQVKAVDSGDVQSCDVESELKSGYQQIVAIFASLAGRESLDLYRPRRL